jgi:hypothetical protein
MAALDTVQVHVDLERFQQPASMGVLHRQQSGAGEIFSFEYDRAWLDRPEVFAFDPISLWRLVTSIPQRTARTSAFSSTRPRTGGAGC